MYFILNMLYHSHFIFAFNPWRRQSHFTIKIYFQSACHLHWISLCGICSTEHWTCDCRFVQLRFLKHWLSVAYSCILVVIVSSLVRRACSFVLIMLDRSGCVGVWCREPCRAWCHPYGRIHFQTLVVQLIYFMSLLNVHIFPWMVVVCTSWIRRRLQLPVIAPLWTETVSFIICWHPPCDFLQDGHIPGILNGSVVVLDEAIFFNEKIMAPVWDWCTSYGILEELGFVHCFI